MTQKFSLTNWFIWIKTTIVLTKEVPLYEMKTFTDRMKDKASLHLNNNP